MEKNFFVHSDHAYTHSAVPWQLGEPGKGKVARLVHYIAGGGLRAFGRTIHQDECEYRQKRFLTVMAVVGAIYLALWWL